MQKPQWLIILLISLGIGTGTLNATPEPDLGEEVAAAQESESSQELSKEYTIEELEKLSPEDLVALLRKEGVDEVAIQDLFKGDVPEVDPAPQKMSFDAVYKEHQQSQQTRAVGAKERPEKLDTSALYYSGPEMQSVTMPGQPTLEALSNIDGFMNKYVKGRKREAVMLVMFVLYKQVTWLYQQYLVERQNSTKSYANLTLDSLFSVGEFESTPIKILDLGIRLGFGAVRAWLDIARQWRRVKSLQFMMQYREGVNPIEQECRSFVYSVQNAYSLVTRYTHYGRELSWEKEAIYCLILPYIWSAFCSKHSQGNILGNRVFQMGVAAALETMRLQTQSWLDSKVHERVIGQGGWRKFYHASAGIVRPYLMYDLTRIGFKYLKRKALGLELSDKVEYAGGTEYLGRKVGWCAMKAVYLYASMGLMAYAFRHGLLTKLYDGSEKFFNLFVKLGVLSNNPISSLSHGAQSFGVEQGWLDKDQPASSLFEYGAWLWPGAYAKAVQAVITKQHLPEVERRSPTILQDLGSIDGINMNQMLIEMSNPAQSMRMMEIPAALDRIKSAFSAQQREQINRVFIGHIMAELMCDPDSLMGYYVFSTPLLWVGKKIFGLKKLKDTMLPGKLK